MAAAAPSSAPEETHANIAQSSNTTPAQQAIAPNPDPPSQPSAPAEANPLHNPNSFAAGTEWMRGRSRLVISMVFKGRLDVNNLPPPGQDHLIYPQFEDVIQADMMAVPFGSDEVQTTTYKDLYGKMRTKEEYEKYLENEEKMEKPFRGQLRHLIP